MGWIRSKHVRDEKIMRTVYFIMILKFRPSILRCFSFMVEENVDKDILPLLCRCLTPLTPETERGVKGGGRN
jgi:hypothetical protein